MPDFQVSEEEIERQGGRAQQRGLLRRMPSAPEHGVIRFAIPLDAVLVRSSRREVLADARIKCTVTVTRVTLSP
jgi:hypothetical protein